MEELKVKEEPCGRHDARYTIVVSERGRSPSHRSKFRISVTRGADEHAAGFIYLKSRAQITLF